MEKKKDINAILNAKAELEKGNGTTKLPVGGQGEQGPKGETGTGGVQGVQEGGIPLTEQKLIKVEDGVPEDFKIGDIEINKAKDMGDPRDALVVGAYAQQNKAKELAEKLAKRSLDSEAPAITSVLSEDGEAINPLADLLDTLANDKKKEEVGIIGNETDISLMLEKLESEKVYSTIEPNAEKTGPSDYTVILNEEWAESIEENLEVNNIKLVKKSASEKNAILDRFANSGPEISMVLVNSGLYINSSGFGPGEIIAMNNVKANNPALVELTRLDHICQHITSSPIGRMTPKRLIQVVSYYDKESLYYSAYAATYPEKAELNRLCEKCGNEFYVNVQTSDLLLNAEDFGPRADYIRNNVIKYEDLIATSELGTVKVKNHSSGLIVYYRHPSIANYLTILQSLRQDLIAKYSHLVEWVYGIDKIVIRDENGNKVPYTDPNEIIVILSKLKDTDAKYEILDMMNELRPSALPQYGFKESKCPHCEHKNPQQIIPIDQLLFFIARQQDEMAALRWTAREQKNKKFKKIEASKRG